MILVGGSDPCSNISGDQERFQRPSDSEGAYLHCLATHGFVFSLVKPVLKAGHPGVLFILCLCVCIASVLCTCIFMHVHILHVHRCGYDQGSHAAVVIRSLPGPVGRTMGALC